MAKWCKQRGGFRDEAQDLLSCRLLRRHQWKRLLPTAEFELMFECKRCGMVSVPGVSVIDWGS